MISPAELSKNSPFEHFKRAIYQRYPQVSHLEVDQFAHNIQPLEYYDHGHISREYPPVVKWRVGNARFRWSPRPSFKKETWHIFFFSGYSVKADYSGTENELLELIEISVKPEEERERLMAQHNASIPDYKGKVFFPE